jgi:hypothetical protein
MVFIVMTIDSDASFVQGTWILSSWMCPLENVKGECNSASSTSNLKSKLWNTASPPHRETCVNLKQFKYLKLAILMLTFYLWILGFYVFYVLVHVAQNERRDVRFNFKHDRHWWTVVIRGSSIYIKFAFDFVHASTAPICQRLFSFNSCLWRLSISIDIKNRLIGKMSTQG